MNYPTINYYEITLVCFTPNKSHTLSLACLPYYAFKTIDTAPPSITFIYDLIGGNDTIQSNIDTILQHNISLYSLDRNTLQSLRTSLENDNYYLSFKGLQPTENAIGDSNHNNEPFAVVNSSQALVLNGQPNSSLINSGNNNYVANFIIDIGYSDRFYKINITLYSALNPLPQPINKNISQVQNLRDYLSLFFENNVLNSLLNDAQNILSIDWVGDFWQILTDIASLNSRFDILEIPEPVYNLSYTRPRKCKLSGESLDKEITCTYTMEQASKFEEYIVNLVHEDLKKYLDYHTNKDGLMNIIAPLARMLIPANDFDRKKGETFAHGLAPTFPGNIVPDKRESFPLGPGQFVPVATGGDFALPELRIVFFAAETPEPPDTIDINVKINLAIVAKIQKRIFSAHKHFTFSASLGSTVETIVGGGIPILKFFLDGNKGPLFNDCENITSEEDDTLTINRLRLGKHYQGTPLPRDMVNIKQSIVSNNITLTLNRVPLPIRYQGRKASPYARFPNNYVVTYRANRKDFYETIAAKLQLLLADEELVDLISTGVANASNNGLDDEDGNLGAKIVDGFRDLLLKVGNEDFESRGLKNKNCAYIEYMNCDFSYDYYPVPITDLDATTFVCAMLTDGGDKDVFKPPVIPDERPRR